MLFQPLSLGCVFTSLAPVVGEDEADALLSQFPSTDLDTPATKDFVRAEIVAIKDEMNARFHSQMVWMVSTAFTMMTIIIGAMALLIANLR